ncbi:isoleucine--tRNA ligase [Candidatus Shapirobacteria bacterium CG10_big_fil_rev_8_21_14_0_10_48_15]|uniref:Isoleucine--tRNA ligase n=1 Tax=Candidatus Shapirobacteria bacterium CG10_big_fil_rev_8_21_14_0_10_48_15 TaxID=1974484 RepID=A0A2M8L6E3_9BACT|nr:MAG: isoleucine--tRNA ligase [Candidatus Shapirobacteria bacterium CG10_big_fil_rev_8_21_14_0_10_48_15]
MAFAPTTPQPDFATLEKKWLKNWEKSGLLKKYLAKNKHSSKRFSFLDGPITANNPMGVHHAWGRTLKDFFQRYKNMRGYRQRFQNGFDNQGLWVEVEVEKKLGFNNKQDIVQYGIGKFVNQCKRHTRRFAALQTEQSRRLGYFMDWDHSYYTMNNENNYMIWHFLQQCHRQGWLYKGKDAVPWCPRCGTAISQHEILNEEYKKITHETVFFKLPIKNRPNEYFLAWTTTPWTIPANVGLAVNPDLVYAAFRQGDQTLILLKKWQAKILGNAWRLVKEYRGDELVGWAYQGPFDQLPAVTVAQAQNPQTFHTVVADKDLVTAEEGTGIVHLAPGAGQEDFQLGQRAKLPVLAAIDEGADYLPGFGQLSGQNAKNHPELIFAYLKQKDSGRFLFKIAPYTHRYPVCWRCKTELVWRVVDEWYIAMDRGKKPLRQKMMVVAKKIRWLPEFGLKRELDWLKNMSDWLISKKRFWGLALPIWECRCGHFEVIGSAAELKRKAIAGWDQFAGHSPHRPWIDQVKIRCAACGQPAARVPDVGNPWLDAGIVPFSTLQYQTDQKYWRQWFPADFITECFPGQFKNWFYSLIAMSTVLQDTNPFKTLLGHALVRDEKGAEMHKSKGNAIEFNQAAEKMGVDVMRWLYLSQNPRHNLNFGYQVGDKVRRRFHLTLWNVYNFFVTYANQHHWQPSASAGKTKLDRWILIRLHQAIAAITAAAEAFDTAAATQIFEEFLKDLSTWYVRRSRDRLEPAFFGTLHLILVTSAKILAPFVPFLAEEMFVNLTGQESVHLTDWPSSEKVSKTDRQLLSQMALVRQICELGHAARKKAGIKVRQPLTKLRVNLDSELTKLIERLTPSRWHDELTQLIRDELNVKQIIFKKGKRELAVELDAKITPALKEEGDVRELIHQIQQLRRQADCRLDQKIIVLAPSLPDNPALHALLKEKVLAQKLTLAKTLQIKPL